MWPFCVDHHVGIHLDISNASIRINAGKKFITFGLPLLCVVIEKRFGHHRSNDQILNFLVIERNNQKNWSSFFECHSWWLKIFGCQFLITIIVDWILSVCWKKLGIAQKHLFIQLIMVIDPMTIFFLLLPKKNGRCLYVFGQYLKNLITNFQSPSVARLGD